MNGSIAFAVAQESLGRVLGRVERDGARELRGDGIEERPTSVGCVLRLVRLDVAARGRLASQRAHLGERGIKERLVNPSGAHGVLHTGLKPRLSSEHLRSKSRAAVGERRSLANLLVRPAARHERGQQRRGLRLENERGDVSANHRSRVPRPSSSAKLLRSLTPDDASFGISPMANEPVLSGEIPAGGILDLLREIEARRITGKIRFVVGDETGEVELIAGQIALDQDPLPSGSDPVEALLAARSGIYAVHACLPPLPVSQGDERERRGSLAVHVPADLMTYCEQAGLTGVLEMRNDGRLVEVIYEAGEMLGIRLDGREDADLGEVFAWDQGAFRIVARSPSDVRSRLPPASASASTHPSQPPEDPHEREPTVRWARPRSDGGATSRFAKVEDAAPAREDTGRQFLRVVEMALADVVTAREKARASGRSLHPPPPLPSVRPPTRPTRASRADATVRIVWVAGEPSVEHERLDSNRETTEPSPAREDTPSGADRDAPQAADRASPTPASAPTGPDPTLDTNGTRVRLTPTVLAIAVLLILSAIAVMVWRSSTP